MNYPIGLDEGGPETGEVKIAGEEKNTSVPMETVTKSTNDCFGRESIQRMKKELVLLNVELPERENSKNGTLACTGEQMIDKESTSYPEGTPRLYREMQHAVKFFGNEQERFLNKPATKTVKQYIDSRWMSRVISLHDQFFTRH